jgi:energy-coupling factor transport system permease protein
VLFRFLPTVAMEYSSIRRAQKYRDIGTSFKNLLLRIPQIFEFTLVPLLIRTTKVADELTASAEVRGMKLNGEYNSFHEVKMHVYDWLVFIVVIVCAAGIYYVDYLAGGTM